MPHIRSIWPSFFKHEGLADLDRKHKVGGEVSFAHRQVFAGLWCQADREGRVRDRIRSLKLELVPWDDIDLEAVLCNLHDAGYIVRYEAESERCIWIPSFLKYQRPHPREALSTLPAPPKKPKGGTPPGGSTPPRKPRRANGKPEADPGPTLGEPKASLKGSPRDQPRSVESNGEDQPRSVRSNGHPGGSLILDPGHEDPDHAGAGQAEDSDPDPDKPEEKLAVRKVFEHWMGVRAKPNAKYTDDRKRKIRARLREGYTVEELCTAIDQVANDPWEDRPKFDDLTILLRDGAHVEKFLAMTFRPPRRNGNGYEPQERNGDGGGRVIPNAEETRRMLDNRDAEKSEPPSAEVRARLNKLTRGIGRPL